MLGMQIAGSALLRWCLLALLLAPASGPARARDCEAWPGEPRPLPQVEDRDPLRARWAQLRAQELARRAQDLEAASPVAAHQAWRRALCLDPADERALAGALRTLPLRMHRPEISIEVAVEPESATEFETPIGIRESALHHDVFASLGAPLQVALHPAGSPMRGSRSRPGGGPALEAPMRAESLWRIDRSLAAAEAQAEAASGRSDEARACLARVLALDPGFAFDASTTSPKLLRLLDAARAEQGAAR